MAAAAGRLALQCQHLREGPGQRRGPVSVSDSFVFLYSLSLYLTGTKTGTKKKNLRSSLLLTQKRTKDKGA
jgi:hypothetical protein